MCHRQRYQYVAVLSYLWRHAAHHIVEVAPQGTIRQHHALGEPRSTTGIVDHSQFLRVVHVIMDVFGSEELRVFMTEDSIEVFSGVSQLL